MSLRKPVLATSLALLLLGNTHTIARAPTLIKPIPDSFFHPIELPPTIYEPSEENNRTHPPIIQVDPVARIVVESTPAPKVSVSHSEGFTYDSNVSWYGPGFYGNRTACGYAYTKEILGVAHKTLPCGTKVTFRYNGRSITVPVIDRGPYVAGRQWDLSGGLCVALDHCFTGGLEYKIGS